METDYPKEWYEITTPDGEVENIPDFLTLWHPANDSKAWFVQYQSTDDITELYIPAGLMSLTEQQAINAAVRIIKRNGRLPNTMKYGNHK